MEEAFHGRRHRLSQELGALRRHGAADQPVSGQGDQAGIDALEKQLLAQNAQHKDWTCTEEMMKRTKNGKALYLHCLPADITGVSCAEGEVDSSACSTATVVPLYKEASFKPYIIAAMILMSKVKDPVSALMALDQGSKRKLF